MMSDCVAEAHRLLLLPAVAVVQTLREIQSTLVIFMLEINSRACRVLMFVQGVEHISKTIFFLIQSFDSTSGEVVRDNPNLSSIETFVHFLPLETVFAKLELCQEPALCTRHYKTINRFRKSCEVPHSSPIKRAHNT